jgi:hypothetical protein
MKITLRVDKSDSSVFKIIDTDTGKQLSNICLAHESNSSHVSPNGEIVVYCGSDRCMGDDSYFTDFYQTQTGKSLFTFYDVPLWAFSFSADGKYIYKYDFYVSPDKSLILDANTGNVLESLKDKGELVKKGLKVIDIEPV